MEEKRMNENGITNREKKKKKLFEFIKKKKEERERELKAQKVISKQFQTQGEKNVKPEGLNKTFKCSSKRRKEKKEKLLAIITKKKEEERKRKLLIIEEKKRRKKEKEILKEKREEKREKERAWRKKGLIKFISQKKFSNHIKKEKESTIIKKAQKEKEIKTYLSNLEKTISEINRYPQQQITSSTKNISNFITISKKKIPKKIPIKVKKKVEIEKEKIVPAKKPIGVYKEPFQLKVFLRRNIFKFVFLILLLLWFLEFLMYMKKLVSPEERLKMIVGEIKEEKIGEPVKFEEEKFVYYTKEKIDIEGKRDPFSTGRLTLEVMKKPFPTNIIFAQKPEVISIIKTPKFISILKPEEKISKPETITTSKITPSEKPVPISFQESPASPKLPEIAKVQKTEPVPFVLPQKECPLVYRGRMILEGVEYFFIEGEKRTYRATIGDTVEGYKILKKENGKLYLSKEGLIYEISAQ